MTMVDGYILYKILNSYDMVAHLYTQLYSVDIFFKYEFFKKTMIKIDSSNPFSNSLTYLFCFEFWQLFWILIIFIELFES